MMWQVRKKTADTALDAGRSSEDLRIVTVGDAGAFANRDTHTDLKVALHQQLLDLINLQALEQMSRQQIEAEVGDIVYELLAKQNHALNNAERKALVSDTESLKELAAVAGHEGMVPYSERGIAPSKAARNSSKSITAFSRSRLSPLAETCLRRSSRSKNPA